MKPKVYIIAFKPLRTLIGYVKCLKRIFDLVSRRNKQEKKMKENFYVIYDFIILFLDKIDYGKQEGKRGR